MNNKQNPQLTIPRVSGSICPKCGFIGTDKELVYTEDELMYEKGIDDPQYGGALVEVTILYCPNCGG